MKFTKASACSGARLRPVPVDHCGNFAAEINDILAAGGEAHRVLCAVENGATAGSIEAIMMVFDRVIAETQDARRKAVDGLKKRRGTQMELKAYSEHKPRFWTAAVRKQRRVTAC